MLATGGCVLLQKGKLLEKIAAMWHVSLVLPDGIVVFFFFFKKRIDNVGYYKKSYVRLGFDQENRSHFICLSKGILVYTTRERCEQKKFLQFSVCGTKVHSGNPGLSLTPLRTSSCHSVGSPNAP